MIIILSYITISEITLPPIELAIVNKKNYNNCYDIINSAISNASFLLEKEAESKRKYITQNRKGKRDWNIGSKSFLLNRKTRLIPNINWPSSAEFTPLLGKQMILEYINVGIHMLW